MGGSDRKGKKRKEEKRAESAANRAQEHLHDRLYIKRGNSPRHCREVVQSYNRQKISEKGSGVGWENGGFQSFTVCGNRWAWLSQKESWALAQRWFLPSFLESPRSPCGTWLAGQKWTDAALVQSVRGAIRGRKQAWQGVGFCQALPPIFDFFLLPCPWSSLWLCVCVFAHMYTK